MGKQALSICGTLHPGVLLTATFRGPDRQREHGGGTLAFSFYWGIFGTENSLGEFTKVQLQVTVLGTLCCHLDIPRVTQEEKKSIEKLS